VQQIVVGVVAPSLRMGSPSLWLDVLLGLQMLGSALGLFLKCKSAVRPLRYPVLERLYLLRM
jgi:hypothetical protein